MLWLASACCLVSLLNLLHFMRRAYKREARLRRLVRLLCELNETRKEIIASLERSLEIQGRLAELTAEENYLRSQTPSLN